MKLEYLYDNNNNLKYTLKAITIAGLSIILLFTLMITLNNNNIDYSMYFACACAYIVITLKSSGEIVVSNNDKTYIIIDINYNKDFKVLEKELNDNFYENSQEIINKSHIFKETGKFERINCKNIKIGIYILDNKVVADLNSIKVS